MIVERDAGPAHAYVGKGNVAINAEVMYSFSFSPIFLLFSVIFPLLYWSAFCSYSSCSSLFLILACCQYCCFCFLGLFLALFVSSTSSCLSYSSLCSSSSSSIYFTSSTSSTTTSSSSSTSSPSSTSSSSPPPSPFVSSSSFSSVSSSPFPLLFLFSLLHLLLLQVLLFKSHHADASINMT